jgi:hypothetical protein
MGFDLQQMTDVPSHAFSACSNLQTVLMSTELVVIEDSAFGHCLHSFLATVTASPELHITEDFHFGGRGSGDLF